MKKLLLAASVVASLGFVTPPANAICSYETCPGTSVVCQHVQCHICWYEPPGYQRCIT